MSTFSNISDIESFKQLLINRFASLLILEEIPIEAILSLILKQCDYVKIDSTEKLDKIIIAHKLLILSVRRLSRG